MENKTYKINHKCVICGKDFKRKVYASNLARGRGKVCSQECKRKLSSINNLRGETKNCLACGKSFYAKRGEIKRGGGKYCSRECYSPTPRGKSISLDGYYTINGKKLHRMIMEEHIGRKLLPKEMVHHINNNKLDNRIENLQIVSRSEHNKIHFAGKNHKRDREVIRLKEEEKMTFKRIGIKYGFTGQRARHICVKGGVSVEKSN